MRNIGLVIVNYNDHENTTKLIDNVKEYKIIKRIVVVDNNSKDDSVKVLKTYEDEKVHLIESKVNRGFSEGLNIGAKFIMEKLKDPIVLCSNSDIFVPNEEVLKSMARNIKDDVVCVMPKVKENGKFLYGWKLTNKYQDFILNIPLINRVFRNKFINYKEEYFNTPTSIVDVVYGCFFMIDAHTLKSINYFDNNTFLYYEEYILARKLAKIKKKTLVDNMVYVKHEHDASIGTNMSKLNKYKIYKRSWLYYEKYYNKAHFPLMFLFKVFYYINLIPYKIKALFGK